MRYVSVRTFVEMTDLMPNAKAMASQVFKRDIRNLQDPTFIYSSGHRFYTITISLIRRARELVSRARKTHLAINPVRHNV